MFSKLATPLPHAALTLASICGPSIALAQEQPGVESPNPPVAARSAEDLLLPPLLSTPGIKNFLPEGTMLPERVLALATARGVNPAEIKYEDRKWLICSQDSCTLLTVANDEEVATYEKPKEIQGLRIGDELAITGHKYSQHRVDRDPNYGIPGLGNFKTQRDGSITFIPDPSFKGTVTKSKSAQLTDSKGAATGAEVLELSYNKENLSKVRTRILSELDTTFVLIISVPSQCGPCREYKKDVRQAAQQSSADTKLVFLTINFDTFEEARKVMGAIRLFPTSIFFPAMPDYAEVRFDNGTGWQQRPFLDGVERPGLFSEGRLTQGPLRERISKTLGIRAGLRGIKRTIAELLQ